MGHLIIPGLFDGEHSFTIEPIGANRVRFVQREVFTGLLVLLFARGLEKDTRRGFRETNEALKLGGKRLATRFPTRLAKSLLLPYLASVRQGPRRTQEKMPA